jgi:hypothetical protein
MGGSSPSGGGMTSCGCGPPPTKKSPKRGAPKPCPGPGLVPRQEVTGVRQAGLGRATVGPRPETRSPLFSPRGDRAAVREWASAAGACSTKQNSRSQSHLSGLSVVTLALNAAKNRTNIIQPKSCPNVRTKRIGTPPIAWTYQCRHCGRVMLITAQEIAKRGETGWPRCCVEVTDLKPLMPSREPRDESLVDSVPVVEAWRVGPGCNPLV